MPSSQFPILETLEDRLVLSGLTDGSPVLKKVSFIDADGDQVTVQVSGKVPKGAGFQISGAANGSNIEEINLVGLSSRSDLSITVKPVRAADSDRTTSNAIFTPGYTMVGKITADSQTSSLDRPVEGALTMRHVRLGAAVVSAIDIPETDILGSVSLTTGRTAFVDRINTAAVTTPGKDVSYNPSVGLIDLYDITAKSIRGIQIDGVVAAVANRASGLPSDNTATNDLLGAITVSGNLGGITVRHGDMRGDVSVGGNLGLSSFGKFTGTVSVLGDATVRLPANAAEGTFAAGGHINLGWQPAGGGTGISKANVFAGSGISGLSASLVDPILVPSAYKGTITNTATSTDAGKAIAPVFGIGGEAAFKVVSSNSVGDLRAISFGGEMKVDAGVGGIGAITSSAGGVAGKYTSVGNIGAITATGGAITGAFEASGNIGQITVSTPNTDGLTGTVKAGGAITGIDVAIYTLVGGKAIDSPNISAGADIGPIKVNTVSATAVAVGGVINAANGITSVEIVATTSATGLAGKINADSDGNNTGNLPSISVTNNGSGTAVAGVSGTNLAEIKGASISSALFAVRAGSGSNTTNNLLFAAGSGGIGSITANNGTMAGTFEANGTTSNITEPIVVTGGGIAGKITAGNSITGAITATGGGISAEITASGGNIGQITVSTPAGAAISGKITAASSITGLTATVSSINGGQAIAAGAEIKAGGNIGPIIVNSQSENSEAVAGSILANQGLTNINITANSKQAALTGKINADNDGIGGGTLTAITVTNNGTGAAVAGASNDNRAEIRGASINAVTLTATSGNATGGFATVAATNSISNVLINGNLGGDVRFATTASFSSIGPITGTGTGDQALYVSTGSFGTVGLVKFESLSGGSRLNYDVGADVSSLGNISARDFLLTGALTRLTSIADITASNTADLRNLKAAMSSLGAINVGTLVLPSNLSSVSNLGSLTASQVNTVAPVTLGPTNFGVTGLINIASSSTGGSSDPVTIAFGSYNQSPRIGGITLFAGQSLGDFSRT